MLQLSKTDKNEDRHTCIYRNTSPIRHRPYKWIAPFSKNKNDLITSHPTVIRHLQVLAFRHFPNCNEPQCFITILWGFMATMALFMNNVLRRFYLHYKAWLASSLQWKIRVLSNELPWFDQGKYKIASIISRAYMPHYIRHPHLLGGAL